jgi:hypothetical protein
MLKSLLTGSKSRPGVLQLLRNHFQKRNLITLGENQTERVKPVAEQLGAKEISQDWPVHLPTSNPDGSRLSKEQIQQNMDFNQTWIQEQIQQGEDAIDIGKDPNRFGLSKFLKMERGELEKAKYTNEPVGSWTDKNGKTHQLPQGSTYWKPPGSKQ